MNDVKVLALLYIFFAFVQELSSSFNNLLNDSNKAAYDEYDDNDEVRIQPCYVAVTNVLGLPKRTVIRITAQLVCANDVIILKTLSE